MKLLSYMSPRKPINSAHAWTSQQREQVLTATEWKPEIKGLKVKNEVERAEMLFRQVSDFIEQNSYLYTSTSRKHSS